MKKINILVIGMGHHARRAYIPTLHKLSLTEPVGIFGVDVLPAKETVENFLEKNGVKMTNIYIDVQNDKLSKDAKKILNLFVKENGITGVIISTPPSSHRIYADWAIESGLHILMDKPISANPQMANSVKQAKSLIKDYEYLVKKYKKLNKQKKTVFMINTQRRFEAGFQYVFALIEEVSKKFNIPVTSIQAMHSDGVWIFPDEIIEQKSHSFCEGNGKCSHSGFHLFDIIWQLYKSGDIKSKTADTAQVYSSFLNPNGLLKQFNQADYKNVFGKSYNQRPRRTNKELESLMKGFGEIDAFTNIRLLKNNENICNISLNLLHNSFSRRAWPMPAQDLYKGNGRVKHQYYFIQQGPFQSIQIHNYQSKSSQEINDKKDYEVGGNNHFDIYIFRNKEMFGGNTESFKKVSLKDLDYKGTFDDKRLYHETAKEKVVKEFTEAIRKGFDRNKLTADIETYEIPVKIMSAIYESNAKYTERNNPLVKFQIK